MLLIEPGGDFNSYVVRPKAYAITLWAQQDSSIYKI